MATFKFKKPKLPKKPKIKNPMKGVHRARAMLTTMVVGFIAFGMSFFLIYKQMEREGSWLKTKLAGASGTSARARKEGANVGSGDAVGTAASGRSAASDGAGYASSESSRSEEASGASGARNGAAPSSSDTRFGTAGTGAQPLELGEDPPSAVNSPRITPTFESPDCFWYNKGLAQFNQHNRKANKKAKEYFERAAQYEGDCTGNAETFLVNLRKKGI